MGLHLMAFGLASIWRWWWRLLLAVVGPGLGDFRPRAGAFPRRQAVRRQVREVLPGLRHRRLKLCKFRYGETEYGIGILPLGGYVKMLGQEDNPARLREEMERAKRPPPRPPAGPRRRPAGPTCLHRGSRASAGHRAARGPRPLSWRPPRKPSTIRAATWPRACPSGWRSSRRGW